MPVAVPTSPIVWGEPATQGVIWDIDAFDQWGVELGRSMAEATAAELAARASTLTHDSSTNTLIRRHRQLREARR